MHSLNPARHKSPKMGRYHSRHNAENSKSMDNRREITTIKEKLEEPKNFDSPEIFTNETITQRSGLKSRYESRESIYELSPNGRCLVNSYIQKTSYPESPLLNSIEKFRMNLKPHCPSKIRYRKRASMNQKTAFGHKMVCNVHIPSSKGSVYLKV